MITIIIYESLNCSQEPSLDMLILVLTAELIVDNTYRPNNQG